MIVVDASALLEVLLNTPAGARLVRRLFAPGQTLHAPHLLDLEIAQVLRRYAASGELEPARGVQALEDLAGRAVVALRMVRGHAARRAKWSSRCCR